MRGNRRLREKNHTLFRGVEFLVEERTEDMNLIDKFGIGDF